MKALNKMLCLVDGEHYLPVTKEAIDTLNNLEHIDVVGAVRLAVMLCFEEENGWEISLFRLSYQFQNGGDVRIFAAVNTPLAVFMDGMHGRSPVVFQ